MGKEFCVSDVFRLFFALLENVGKLQFHVQLLVLTGALIAEDHRGSFQLGDYVAHLGDY